MAFCRDENCPVNGINSDRVMRCDICGEEINNGQEWSTKWATGYLKDDTGLEMIDSKGNKVCGEVHYHYHLPYLCGKDGMTIAQFQEAKKQNDMASMPRRAKKDWTSKYE